MGTLNQRLGFNLTDDDPLQNSPFNLSESEGYIVPPPIGFYMITEIGQFMQTETGNNLMVVE